MSAKGCSLGQSCMQLEMDNEKKQNATLDIAWWTPALNAFK